MWQRGEQTKLWRIPKKLKIVFRAGFLNFPGGFQKMRPGRFFGRLFWKVKLSLKQEKRREEATQFEPILKC
jgi:hypothetical protein